LEGKALINFMTGIFSSQEKSTFRIVSKSTAFERRRISQIYNILGLRPRPLDFTIRAIYSNLDKFKYTYGSGKYTIILKPVR